jgi:hypothetical protein
MEDIIVPIAGMLMVLGIVVGIPIARAYAKRLERSDTLLPQSADLIARLDRIEQAIEAMSTEVERITEGQRFTTKLLADSRPSVARLPSPSTPLQSPEAVGGVEDSAPGALGSRSSSSGAFDAPGERP